jgi:DNA repair exonuclease SbcCD ATPase subunit
LIQAGEKVIGWMYDEVSKQTGLITASKSNDPSVALEAFWLSPKMANASKFIELAQFRPAQFLLPIPDPTIQLQHSLTQALNECDELRQKNERLMVIIEELQSDLDTAKNDLTVADAAIEELKAVTLDPYIANRKLESQLKEQDCTISNLKDQIDGRDAFLRGSAKIIQELNQEIERLQEASKSVQPIAHNSAERIDQLREVIDQNNKAFAQENERLLAVIEERCNKIDILEDNLDRSDSDRLSELTSIMRMVQALESIPMLDRLSGAIHLIKRVIYDAICKLDPSQAVDP